MEVEMKIHFEIKKRRTGQLFRMMGLSLLVLMIFALVFSPVNAKNWGFKKNKYEKPPVLKASKILEREMLRSEYHYVKEDVMNDGYLNLYTVVSPYGEFEAHGNIMLRIRVLEMKALAELDNFSKSKVVLDALKDAGINQAKAIVTVVKHPVETVKGVPGGINRMFKRAKRGAGKVTGKDKKESKSDKEKEADDSTEADKEESGTTKVAKTTTDLAKYFFGVSKAEREWAAKLGTDPYTTNLVLRQSIKNMARLDRTVRIGTKFLPIPSIPGARYIQAVNSVVWSKDPYELMDYNKKRLKEMGLADTLISSFFENSWLSPTLQTILITALTNFENMPGLPSAIERIIESESELEARFLVETVVLLAWYHRNETPFDLMMTETRLPLALTKDHRLFAIFPVDYLFWTEGISTAVQGFPTKHKKYPIKGKEFWFTGKVSEKCGKELGNLEWNYRENVGGMVIKSKQLQQK
jgi:hypothetical protein